MNISQTSSFLNIVLSLGRQLVGKWSVVGTFNKTHFESLNTKKNKKQKNKKRIIEPSGKLLFLFSQKGRQKLKRLSLISHSPVFN